MYKRRILKVELNKLHPYCNIHFHSWTKLPMQLPVQLLMAQASFFCHGRVDEGTMGSLSAVAGRQNKMWYLGTHSGSFSLNRVINVMFAWKEKVWALPWSFF